MLEIYSLIVIIWIRVLLTSASGHNIPNLVIILLKSQLLQFPMHLIHNFSLKAYYLKWLKSVPKTLTNIFLWIKWFDSHKILIV